MKEGEKFPEFGPFLCWHKWSCSTITEFRRDFWCVGLNGLQILAGLLPSPGTEQGQRPTFLAVPPRDSAAVLYSTTTDDPWSLLCPGFCVPGTAPQGQTHPKHSQRGLGIVSRSWDSTKRHRSHSWGWLHPKGIPGAWGRVRQPQREDHREKLIFSLQIYLSWLVVELWGNTQTHSVLSALILRSDNSFFMYWSIINQIYLEGQHDPIQADPKVPVPSLERCPSFPRACGSVSLSLSSLHKHLLVHTFSLTNVLALTWTQRPKISKFQHWEFLISIFSLPALTPTGICLWLNLHPKTQTKCRTRMGWISENFRLVWVVKGP